MAESFFQQVDFKWLQHCLFNRSVFVMVDIEYSKSCCRTLNARDLSIHKPSGQSWKRLALDYLEEMTGFTCDNSNVKYESRNESPVSRHLYYHQFLNSVPLTDAWLRLDLDLERDILIGIHCRLCDDRLTKRTRTRRSGKGWLTKSQASRIAINRVRGNCTKCGDPKYRLFRKRGTKIFRMAIKATVRDSTRRLWILYFDCKKGSLLYRYPSAFYSMGSIFDPNPAVALNNPRLRPGDQCLFPRQTCSVLASD